MSWFHPAPEGLGFWNSIHFRLYIFKLMFPTESRCSLIPGAQLSTFDGLSGKVPAPGTFQLTSLCDFNSDYWFRVIVEVSSCPPNGVVTANLLYFFYKGLFITVNRQKEAWVSRKLNKKGRSFTYVLKYLFIQYIFYYPLLCHDFGSVTVL